MVILLGTWDVYAASSIPRVTFYTAAHLHTAVPHCSHSRAPIVHTAVPRENNEHGCVYLRCRAVCKLPDYVEGRPWYHGYWCAGDAIKQPGPGARAWATMSLTYFSSNVPVSALEGLYIKGCVFCLVFFWGFFTSNVYANVILVYR